MKRRGSAVWNGGLKDGKGKLSTESGVLKDAAYSFGTRFESGIGTNPEELIGAAHAGCFSMALSMILGDAGHPPETIQTTATVTLDHTDKGPTVTAVHLDVSAKVPNLDVVEFARLADQAKSGCVVSRLLNATITMDAKLT